jgi:hypothetical protein
MQCGAACWVKDAGAGAIVLKPGKFISYLQNGNNPAICLIFLTNGVPVVS